MASWKRYLIFGTIFLLVGFLVTGCNLLSGLGGSKTTATQTPTTMPGGDLEQPEEPKNPCEGLTGTLELQLLVGPSEAVGLTPFTMASVPFTTSDEGDGYLVQGNGPVEYYEDVLEAEWGSYTVQFEGETTVSGTCFANDTSSALNIYLKMKGKQTVVVVVEGMEMAYPWAGTPELTMSFPIENGAQQAGEGWAMILHFE